MDALTPAQIESVSSLIELCIMQGFYIGVAAGVFIGWHIPSFAYRLEALYRLYRLRTRRG